MTLPRRPAARPRAATHLIALLLALTLGLAPAPAGQTLAWAQTPARNPIDHLPRLGDPSGDELSPQAERQLGESIMRQIRRDPAYLDDAEAVDFLTRFVEPLLATPAAAGQRFQFFLVDDGSINAFALPGGFIGVHAGLIASAQSESELASVLAHEIAHVTQRHVVRMIAQQRRGSMLSMAAMALALLAARSNPQAAMGGMMLGDHVMRTSALSFSRDAEREADRLGLEMLRQAGFEPQGMAAFFNRLQQATRVYDTQAPVYLRTHPLTTERIADIEARLPERREQAQLDSLEFGLLQARLRATVDSTGAGRQRAREQAEIEVKALGKPPGDRAADDRSAVRSLSSDATKAWFGLASISAAQGDARRMTEALVQARAALGPASDADHPWFVRLEAASRLESGDAAGALDRLSRAIRRFPEQRALIRLQAQALIALPDTPQAVLVLEEATRIWPQDDALWRMLAQAYEQRGLRARAHRAAAERFVLLGAFVAAADQLRRAQRAGDPDFYIASMIDARLREIEPAARRELEESRQAGRDPY